MQTLNNFDFKKTAKNVGANLIDKDGKSEITFSEESLLAYNAAVLSHVMAEKPKLTTLPKNLQNLLDAHTDCV